MGNCNSDPLITLQVPQRVKDEFMVLAKKAECSLNSEILKRLGDSLKQAVASLSQEEKGEIYDNFTDTKKTT